MSALIGKDYALATHKRYETARFHAIAFINYKYGTDDLEMREFDYDFIISYEIYLKTVKNCVNNSALKYIDCLRKVIFRAIDNNIITQDPFKAFKKRITPTNKKPLTAGQLYRLENLEISTQRLEVCVTYLYFSATPVWPISTLTSSGKQISRSVWMGSSGLCPQGRRPATRPIYHCCRKRLRLLINTKSTRCATPGNRYYLFHPTKK